MALTRTGGYYINETSLNEQCPDTGKFIRKRTMMFIAVFFLALAFILLLNVGTASAETTYVESDIVSDTVWNSTGSPYIVNDTIYVDASLTIESNVTVEFGPDAGLIINGSLLVQGTEDEPVLFTSNESMPSYGAWEGIYVTNVSANAVIQHAVFEYADIAILVENSDVDLSFVEIWYVNEAAVQWTSDTQDLDVVISNVDVYYSYQDGFRLGAFGGYNGTFAVSDCTLSDLDGAAIYTIADGTVNAVLSDIELTDIGWDAFVAFSDMDVTVSYTNVIVDDSGSAINVETLGNIDFAATDSSFNDTYYGICLYAEGDIVADLSNVSVTNVWDDNGIVVFTDLGTVDTSFSAVTVENADVSGIIVEGATVNVDVFEDVTVSDCGEDGIMFVQSTGDLALDLSGVAVDECDRYGVFVSVPNGMADVTADACEMINNSYAALAVESKYDATVLLNDTYMSGNGMGLGVTVEVGDVTIDLTGCELVENDGAVYLMDTFEGDVILNIVDSVIDRNFDGVSIEAFNGTVDVTINDSTLSDNEWDGLYVDSMGDVTIAVSDSTINGNDYGIAVLADGAVDVTIIGSSLIENVWSSLEVYAVGDIAVDITDSSLSSSYYGMWWWSYTVDLETNGHVDLVIDGVAMDGASTEASVEYWYDEAEYEWDVLVPENRSTSTIEYIELPFTFPYAGNEYDYVYMVEYGYLTFDYYTGYNFNFWSMYRDMIVPAQGNFQAYEFPYYGWEATNDSATFQWYVQDTYGLTDLFEVILYPSGEIEFVYNEMETIDYYNYAGAYGLVYADGGYTDLRYDWGGDFYTVDYRAVKFTPVYSSMGTAVYVWADEGINASAVDSTFANFEGDTFYLQCYDEMVVYIDNCTFFNAGYGPYLDSYNGSVDITIINSELSYIDYEGIYVYSVMEESGADSVVIQNNVFTEIDEYAVYIDSDMENYLETFDSEIAWTITDNVFVSTEGIYLYLEMDNEECSSDLDFTLDSSRNVFEDLDYYMLYLYLDVYNDEGDLDYSESIVIEDNVASGDEDGICIEEYVEVYIGDLNIDSTVTVADNELTLEDAYYGFYLYAYDEVVDGDAIANRIVDVIGNQFLGYYDYYGIYVEIYEYIGSYWNGSAMGQGDFNSTLAVDISGNVVDYSDEAGIEVYVYSESYNNWGTMTVDLDLTIASNQVVSWYGIYVDYEIYSSFDYYYPAYEQEVEQSVLGTFDVLIDSNVVVSESSGIEVYYGSEAFEGGRSSFAHAVADLVATIDVTNNDVTSYGGGIFVDSHEGAYGGFAAATLDSTVSVQGNDVVITMGIMADPDVIGIAVGDNQYVEVNSMEFTDGSYAAGSVVADISGNTVDGASSGILTGVLTESIYGTSSANTDFVVDVYNNVLTNISYCGIGALNYLNTAQYSTFGFETNATISSILDVDVESNSISMVDEDAIGIIVSPLFDGYFETNINSTVVVDILGNTVIGGEIGVYVYDGDHFIEGVFNDAVVTTIIGNVIESEYGVFVYNSDSTINDNTIVASEWGIYIIDADIVATGNTITGVGELTLGVNARFSVSEFTDNEIIDCYTGASFFYGNVTFDSNLVQGGEYGLVLESDYAWVSDNQFIECSVYGITDYAPFTAGVEDVVYEIVGNTFDGCGYGAYMIGEDLLFASNMVMNSEYDGGYFSVAYSTIEGNTFADNGYDGAYLYECYYVLVANNTFSGNGYDGLDLYDSSNVVLMNGVYADNIYYGLNTDEYDEIEWIVDGVSEVRNNPVFFYGMLTIVDGGELTMVNVPYFEFYSYEARSELIVEEGGTLIAINSDIDGSYNYFVFEVYGVLEMENTYVSDADTLYLGPTSEATIANSFIYYMDANGIYVDDCSPEITNTLISDNERDGIYVTGANAAPVIMGCFISDNWRGMYVYQASTADVVDNIFFDNYMAGVYLEQVTGAIHDNVFLFNMKEIFVKDCDVSIVDNEIGYGNAASYMMELMTLSEVYEMLWYDYYYYLSEPMEPGFEGYWFMDLMNPAHIGIYADGSTVTAMDNVYGLVYTAVYCVDSTLVFSDSVESNSITVPYVTVDLFGVSLGNMTFDAEVFDGIKARNSDVTITGAYFDVLDDAVFLDGCTATISDTVFDAEDNDVYLMGGSTVDTHGSDLDEVLVESGSTMMAYKVVSVHLVNEDNRSVEGAEVEIISEDGLVVASGETDDDGDFSAEVLGARYTGDGVEEMDYTVNVTHKSQKVSMPATDEMTIELPGSGDLLDNDTAFLIAIAVAALLAVALVAVAFKKD